MNEILQDMYETEDTLKGKYLIFSLDRECYGIEIRFVIEIIGIQTITEIPNLPSYIKGVINLRGKIIPVMDVRLRFNKAERMYDDRTCTIVVDINGVSIGLIVDRVSEVINIADTDIAAPPALNQNSQNKYINGIGKIGSEVRLLLNCDKLLNEDELEILHPPL